MRRCFLAFLSSVLLSGCTQMTMDGLSLAPGGDLPTSADPLAPNADGAPALPLIGGSDILAKGPPPIDYQTFRNRARSGKYAATEVEKLRHEVLRDAATAYAAQAGYYRRAYEIMQQLERESIKLSGAFNFNRVVYVTPKEAGFVVPPIVTRATSALQINDAGTESVAADEFYRIEQPGRLVGVVPTWRDYLVLSLDEPNEPDIEYLPQDGEERKIFDAYLEEGWVAGVGQADAALQAAMNELRRDYLGMIEYRRLVDAGLIQELAIRWDERRTSGELNELYIGERTVRIVDAATFVRNPAKWEPVTRRFAGS
ncbi:MULTISPECIES: type IV secretory system conjugative DNA transfer family protein [unclassified Aurantimonas]|uniref:type IV secretory system conjugative DNA transfer family protein n=1 Tax=unclassified Aurantimonas TaxID=2638230 RepID=UPI002E193983|nr:MULTISPECIES: type IV secretory system conjugative DNA transfer family protein [unclassified Aurantimonas]MEC5291926.1 type IV secretory system conjugative DNA transfer family protein [Aurantimonas sp. C2-3-R2]MEC5413012.1 type IV secretory system conjugative DNA transfer family protein [Aurantimonas sp. C2-4-R8]